MSQCGDSERGVRYCVIAGGEFDTRPRHAWRGEGSTIEYSGAEGEAYFGLPEEPSLLQADATARLDVWQLLCVVTPIIKFMSFERHCAEPVFCLPPICIV